MNRRADIHTLDRAHHTWKLEAFNKHAKLAFQPLHQSSNLCGFPGPIKSFNHNEESARLGSHVGDER